MPKYIPKIAASRGAIRAPPPNAWLPGPTGVHVLNGTSIGSAVLSGSRLCPTDTQRHASIHCVHAMRPNDVIHVNNYASMQNVSRSQFDNFETSCTLREHANQWRHIGHDSTWLWFVIIMTTIKDGVELLRAVQWTAAAASLLTMSQTADGRAALNSRIQLAGQ